MNKKAERLGFTRLMRSNDNARKLLKMATALLLLPADRLLVGFESPVQFTIEANLHEPMSIFLEYVRHQWIEGVGSLVFLVNNQCRHTNTNMEAYHRTLLQKIGLPHPDIWTFTDGLRKQEKSYVQKLGSLRRGLNVARPQRRAYLLSDSRIAAATARLQ